MLDIKIDSTWKEQLKDYLQTKNFYNLMDFVYQEYKINEIFPADKNIFRAFELCPFDKVKVVILGQDPYHGAGQAHGLSFSVQEDIALPASLRNIYKEIRSDLSIQPLAHGNLIRWAEQGVFLLNSILTVQKGKPASHKKKGWEEFTDFVIKQLNEQGKNIVFLLWGKYAQKKGEFIDESKHLVLRTSHPSPYSVNLGFLGSKHFSKANEYLLQHKKRVVNWQ